MKYYSFRMICEKLVEEVDGEEVAGEVEGRGDDERE